MATGAPVENHSDTTDVGDESASPGGNRNDEVVGPPSVGVALAPTDENRPVPGQDHPGNDHDANAGLLAEFPIGMTSVPYYVATASSTTGRGNLFYTSPRTTHLIHHD